MNFSHRSWVPLGNERTDFDLVIRFKGIDDDGFIRLNSTACS